MKTWSVEEGLPASSPTFIVQTPDGYLWIGTWNGLARFDGLRFVSFHSGNTPALMVSRVSVLYVDTDSSLWVGTGGGGLVQYKSGVFRSWGVESGLDDLFVNGCVRDRQGILWVGTEQGLFRMEEGRFLTAGRNVPAFSGEIHRIYADSNGSLVVNVPGGGYLATWVGDSMRVDRAFGGGEVLVDGRGRLWHWDRHSVLRRTDGATEKVAGAFRQFRHTATWPLRDGGVGICFLRRIVIVRDGGMTYLPSIQRQAMDAPEVLFEDPEGNLWLGRASAGLSRVRESPVRVLTTASGLSSDIAASISEDADGSLWVGTYRLGLNVLVGDRFRPFENEHLPPTASVNLLWQDPDKVLWAGLNLGGLVPVGGGGRPYVRGIVSSTSNVWAADADSNGVWWVGTSHHGVQQDSAGRLTVWNRASGLTSDDISSLLCARDGSTWVGTRAHGLNRIVRGAVTAYGRADGLTSEEVTGLYEDDDGVIWIATRRGLNRYSDGILSGLTERDGLADEAIASIVPDGHGNLWFGGTKGIFRATLSDLNARADGGSDQIRSRAFGTEDGLPGPEVGGGGSPRAWRDRSGILWFASERGLVRIDPRAVRDNPIAPPVVIEEVLLDHEPVTTKGPVVMQPRQTKVEFQFTGISFRSTNNVRFRYRLEGLEDHWQDGGSRRFAQYTNLPSGDYTFRVSAANSDGLWNEMGASIMLTVLPPFYASWWFLTLVLLFFLTSGPTLYVLRIRALKREHHRQQEFGRKLIERQEEERKRIARDMHDSLGQELLVLKHRMQARLRKGKLAKESAALLTTLSDSVGGTITLVRQISHNLRPPELDRLGLTETLKAMLERVRSTKIFEISGMVEDVDGCVDKEDEINVVRIVQEALNNVIKHAKASRVLVSVTTGERHVDIRVEDNGVGLPVEPRPGSGLGLADMKERAALMNGTCEYEAGENGGTVVRVSIPRRNAHAR